MTSNDPHHCRCFSINEDNIDKFEELLIDFGFQDTLQEDHGQVYGYALRVEDRLQLHLKVMPDGNIEAEMEPPPAYPAAHLNEKHSYSAHDEVGQVLRAVRIRHHTKLRIPKTCREPIIEKPINPTHAAGFAVGIGFGLLAAFIVKKLMDREDNESA